MLNQVWSGVLLAAVVFGMTTGKGSEMAAALTSSGEDAIGLTLTLLAAMTLWSGLMEILCEAGDVRRLGKLFRKVTAPAFGGLKDEACWEAMSMNLAANLLGVGNAATPAGVRAAQLLSAQGETGLRALAALLALNNAGIQLMPTTVITMRQAAGSADPAGIWGVSLAAATAAAVVSMLVLQLLNSRVMRRKAA